MKPRSARDNWRLTTVVLLLAAGCIAHPQNPAATQPATAVDPATTQPSYWYSQGGLVVRSDNFEKLFTACEEVAREFFFKIDRIDYRSGVLTTKPMISAQWFEPWRRDVRTIADRNESSIATIRRTIRFEFSREGDKAWAMTPKVLVERQVLAGRRITSVALYRRAFSTAGSGSIESDQGVLLPQRYWYPVRRDIELEHALARAVQKKLGRW